MRPVIALLIYLSCFSSEGDATRLSGWFDPALDVTRVSMSVTFRGLAGENGRTMQEKTLQPLQASPEAAAISRALKRTIVERELDPNGLILSASYVDIAFNPLDPSVESTEDRRHAGKYDHTLRLYFGFGNAGTAALLDAEGRQVRLATTSFDAARAIYEATDPYGLR